MTDIDSEFWLQRWHEGRIGFHQDGVTPLLEKHWEALALPASSRVFVPLAGKSLDMLWLVARGHRVLGVEVSALAIEQFFAEHDLHPQSRDSRYGRRYVAGNIELICGDVFDLDTEVLADCAGVYDRAALIALPPPLRQRYVTELHPRLPIGCSSLLITLEYSQAEMEGPPFSVDEAEVRSLYGPIWSVDLLERRNILTTEARFREDAVTELSTAVYRLKHNTEF